MSDDFSSADLPADSILSLVRQLQDSATFEAAAPELWQRVQSYLEWRAAALIAERFRGRVSEEDAAIEAFKSFLSGAQRGKYSIRDRDGLFGLLAKMVKNKLRSELRKLQGPTRNPGADGPGEIRTDDSGELDRGRKPFYANEQIKRDYRTDESIDSEASLDSECRGQDLSIFLKKLDAAARLVIKEKIDTLEADLQEFFVLRYIDGFTDEQIAKRMHISLQAVRYMHETIKEVFGDLRNSDSGDFGSEIQTPSDSQ